MNRQYLLGVLVAALVLCLGVSLLLMSRVNDARVHIAQAGPGAFNYLLQSNSSLNEFIESLHEYGAAQSGSEAQLKLRKLYQQRFDVLWGGFTVFDIDFRFRAEQQQQVSDLLGNATDYLENNEPLMASDYRLSQLEIDKLIVGARSIIDKVNDVGHEYFMFAVDVSDRSNEKLQSLYRLFWVCVTLLMVTAGLLFSMLMRSMRNSAGLIEKSEKNQAEMKQLIAELRSGKLESKAKDSFIAAASHDLRQPLHALGLFLGATEKHIVNQAGREALAEAKHCTAELNRLFNSLLDLSRLDAGVVAADKTRFKVDDLLQLMDQEFSVSADKKNVRFEVCECMHFLETDAMLLNRILRNLLENAFTHSGATFVQILCNCRSDEVRLTVSDNGCGIPLAEQTDIFSEYYQLNNPERDRSKGLGLGLSIVKRLCEILDVNVSLESDTGTGTRFHLDIPASASQSRPLRETTLATPERTTVGDDILVAVIDDDVTVRKGMVAVLESLGLQSVAAESAVEMNRELRLRALMPDVLIADYRLQDNETGDRAIAKVRKAFGKDIPAMIITGDTSPARMSEAANSGFELMHKPVEPDELIEQIGKMLDTPCHAVAQ